MNQKYVFGDERENGPSLNSWSNNYPQMTSERNSNTNEIKKNNEMN